jgi:hypothetical protein
VADTKDRTRPSAGPSNPDTYKELDIDSALEKLETSRQSPKQEDVLEPVELELEAVEDDTDKDQLSEDEPEDTDFEDDDADEVDTPDDSDSDEVEVISQEPADAPKKPTKQVSKGQLDTEDSTRLSRKRRGKLIEELRLELQEEQKRNLELQQQTQLLQEEDKRLNEEVDKALGSEAAFDKAMEDALNGDEIAAERVRIWRNNREFFKKLQKKAEREYSNNFMNFGWEQVKGLDGVTMEMLQASTLANVLKDIYHVGFNAREEKHAKELEELQKKYDTLKTQFKAVKPQSGSKRRNPVTSGGSVVAEKPIEDWRRKYRDPNTGLLTDEAEAIVSQYGFEALVSGKFKKG